MLIKAHIRFPPADLRTDDPEANTLQFGQAVDYCVEPPVEIGRQSQPVATARQLASTDPASAAQLAGRRLGEMLEKCLETCLTVRHVVEDLGHDRAPTQNLTLIVGAITVVAVVIFLPAKCRTETLLDHTGLESTAERMADGGVGLRSRWLRVYQCAHGVEKDRTDCMQTQS